MKIYTYRDYKGNSLAYAKKCVEHYLGRTADLSYYGTGKPYVVDADVFVSISHTGHDLAVAVSDKEVGIDIENKKYRHYINIAERFLEKDCRDINEFYAEWTKYEAQFKHGGDDGKFCTLDIFECVVMTIYSEDEEYIFLPMQNII